MIFVYLKPIKHENSTNMKSIVLGMMIASVSVSFAQTDAPPSHQLKNKFSAKQQMVVQPADAQEVKANSDKVEFAPLSRKDVKSSIVHGIIRMDKGTPVIEVKMGSSERLMVPLNLPKAMAVNGQKIQFSYMVADAKTPKKLESAMVVNIYDVAISPRK